VNAALPSFPLYAVLGAIAAWLAIGTLGLAAHRQLRFVSRVLFPLGSAVGAFLAIVAVLALGDAPSTLVLPHGLPDQPFHVRLDPLSAFFLLVLGAAGAAISLFSVGYFRSSEGTAPGLICFLYHAFLAAMAAVLVADDALDAQWLPLWREWTGVWSLAADRLCKMESQSVMGALKRWFRHQRQGSSWRGHH
jgi:NADH:ubiquinone oxidoreductase subunit 5 (subunit L)/multisubunit Na+/H+ antiporter MnhA subunit